MFAFKAAAVVLILFALAVLRDRRSFANAVLLGLVLALLALGFAERLARTDDAASRLVLLAVFALVAVVPFVVAAYSSPLTFGSSLTELTNAPSGIPFAIFVHVFPPSIERMVTMLAT